MLSTYVHQKTLTAKGDLRESNHLSDLSQVSIMNEVAPSFTVSTYHHYRSRLWTFKCITYPTGSILIYAMHSHFHVFRKQPYWAALWSLHSFKHFGQKIFSLSFSPTFVLQQQKQSIKSEGDSKVKPLNVAFLGFSA